MRIYKTLVVIVATVLTLWSAFATADESHPPSHTVVQTRHLSVEIAVPTATWSVEHKPSGCRLAEVRPELGIEGLSVDWAACRAATPEVTEVQNRLGAFSVVKLVYETRQGLLIKYTLSVSQQNSNLIVELSIENNTGRSLVIHETRAIVARTVMLGGDTSSWMAIGDARMFHEHYTNHVVATMGEKKFWWYSAVKNLDTGKTVLLGNLTNHKGIGRFVCAPRDQTSMRMTAYCDYESIVMPSGASIPAEKVLVDFGSRGTDSLERFGTLIAKEHRIDLMEWAPIDVENATISSLFNRWNSFGSSVIKGVEYSHDPQYKRAFQDPNWRRKNEELFAKLGLWKYIHPALPDGRRPTANKQALVRNYGRPDWWFPDAREVYEQHPEFYINGRIDFSNPEALAFERQRATAFFRANRDNLVTYGADFTSNWRKLPGQHDPFFTSVESFRACMKIWRDLAREHPSGCYSGVCMNDIGFCYDVWDNLRIGGDSDQGYYGNGLTFTAQLIRQASGRYFYNGKVWWNNPDSFHVFAQGVYSYDQAKVHASFCAIAGNRIMPAEPFCDQETPQERLEIIKRVLPTTPDVATAVDLFEHNPARLWNMPIERPFGRWNVVGLFNFDELQNGETVTQEIRFADLGLSPDKEYLVYEFWLKNFLGALKGGFTRRLDAPDCEVYSVVEKRDHPVLVSTNRHVRQMAYDLVALEWDSKADCLRGTSRVVGDDPYQVRIYVPLAWRLREVNVADLDAKVRMTNERILLVEFTPRDCGRLNWDVRFQVISE